MSRCFYLCSLLVGLSLPYPAAAQLLLAGGSLPVCSSVSPAACSAAVDWDARALDAHRFELTMDGIERWQTSLGDRIDSPEAQAWTRLLQSLTLSGSGPLRRTEFSDRIRGAVLEMEQADGGIQVRLSGEQLYQGLDDRAWWQLLDHFQQPQADQGEQVRLNASRSQAVIGIFQRFVAMAGETSGRERPRIAISTASSRDPYDALDFYSQVFEQAGADVYWLPLDRAFTAARAAGRCADLAEFQAELLGTWDRARVYPAAFGTQQAQCEQAQTTLRLAEGIDGLFLNGGDQWLTLHAFIDEQGRTSPEWQRIMARLEAGELVLGGTSAGAAVQSGAVMISNGSSQRALLDGASERPPPEPGCDRAARCPPGLSVDALTYHRGGLGSFAPGIVDTHFSERWRQFRLLQLMVDTGVHIGLGVDETSAVEVQGLFDEQPLSLSAIGESGGWLIAGEAADLKRTRPVRVDRVRLHHLAPGAQLLLAEAILPAGNTDPDKHEASEAFSADCVDASEHASFAVLPLPIAESPNAKPLCLLLTLNDVSVARSLLRPRPPPPSAAGPVSSWDWSLEVVPRAQPAACGRIR